MRNAIITVGKKWREVIYSDIGGIYNQQKDGIITFKNGDQTCIKEYLGTYFMRSMVESFGGCPKGGLPPFWRIS